MTTPDPSLELLRKVRAAFVLKDSTLKAWCRQNGIHMTNARNALIGSWNGPAGQAMRRRVVKASGLKDSA
ncbi:hypothetical protein RDV84_00275 [Lysobacter yananisis]|uniref:Uncharacterized protein n=1 Tax=Lysobacter yananisis TaxID=1003114 RepID=A0ABY9PAW4_9GAMM|nr:hypothetical protein [Lysobacter yananisis]WMT03326.1 hypothetical protein RDV84_00275 [Lysobacter yananisis]